MPIKMLAFILIVAVLITFVGLNWDNVSDIDLWFNQKLHFENVSIVLSFMIVFLAGMVTSIPFWLDSSFQKRKKERRKSEEPADKGRTVIKERRIERESEPASDS